MGSSTWRRLLLCGIGSVGFSAGTLVSQDVHPSSSMLVIRNQFGSIAEEACAKVQLPPKSSVAVWVEAEKNSAIAENAFLATLQGKGCVAFLRKTLDSAKALIRVNVLSDRVEFARVGHDEFARTIQTSVEVRAEYRGDQPATILGQFTRSLRDTVSQNDAEVVVNTGGPSSDEDATVFQRLLGPVIVLAGGIIVVYLFFTVRS